MSTGPLPLWHGPPGAAYPPARPPYGPPAYGAPPGLPFGPPPPPPGPPPRFRERRPVRWWMVLAGVGGSVLWYLLITLLSWSAPSFVLLMLLGMITAGAGTWVLLWRGDRGLAVGVGAMVGVALSYTVLGAAGIYLVDGLTQLP